MSENVLTTKKEGGAYLVIRSELIQELIFLARNPEDGGLFLLAGRYPSYSLWRGKENGLKPCEVRNVQPFGDCIALMFAEEDKVVGEITVPCDPKGEKQPIFNEFGADNLVHLEPLPCRVAR